MKDLLKISLSQQDKPSEELNKKLKIELLNKSIENNLEKRKSISIWWIPGLVSCFTSVVFSLITYLFIPNFIIQMLVMSMSLLTIALSISITIIGLRFFKLREGAVIYVW